MQSSLQPYDWDYSRLAETVDELFVQTQTYCKESPQVFAEAIDTLKEQYDNRIQLRPWIPQVTVDPDAPNGTTVEQARAVPGRGGAAGAVGSAALVVPKLCRPRRRVYRAAER